MNRLLAHGVLALMASAAGVLPQQPAGSSLVEPSPLLMRQLARNRLPTMPYRFHQGRPLDATNMVRAADVDLDGDPDLVLGPGNGLRPRLLLNDGAGRFAEATMTHMPSLTTVIVTQFQMVDLDGDGDLDFIGANYSSPLVPALGPWRPVTILENDGTGHFSDVSALRGILAYPTGYTWMFSSSCAAADFDGDGDVDVVLSGGGFAGYGRLSCRYWQNDGTGHFTYDAARFPSDTGQHADEFGDTLAVDFDLDGDIDLISPSFSPGPAIWINDGTGNFSEASTSHIDASAFAFFFRTVELGDVDNDGDLDLFAAVIPPSGRHHTPQLFLNDGSGHFANVTATQVPIDAIGGSALHFGDFDEDGDLDLVSVIPPIYQINYPGESHCLVNDGSGRFELDRERRYFGRFANGYCHEVAVADLDADGDLDTVEASESAMPDPPEYLPYYINTSRHVSADSAPRRAFPWRVRIHGTPNSTAVLALALRAGNLPLPPLGRLGLDPASLVLWQPFAVIPAGRELVYEIQIPNLPQLAGAPLYVQALLNEPGKGLRLSNTWSEAAIQ